MKTIAFYHPDYALPIPAVGGGAVEELQEILIDENDKELSYNFIVFQPNVDKKTKYKLNNYDYHNTKLVFIKRSRMIDFIVKAINKIIRLLKIKFQLITTYEKNFLNSIRSEKIDKIIFEGNYPKNILKKLSKLYGKDNLYLHIHSNYQEFSKTYNFIGNYIGVSEFVLRPLNDLNSTLEAGASSGFVLKNCVRDSKFSSPITIKEKLTIRESLGYSKDDFIIIFCGRIMKIKGVKELIDAVLGINNDKIKLLLIGSPNFSRGSKSDYLQQIIELAKNNPNKIKFSGYIPNTEVPKYYQVCDLHVVPSIYNDPAPLVVIEGLKSGLPQICTESGGIPEYVNSEGTIIIDRINNVKDNIQKNIELLYNDKKKLDKMRVINLEQGKKYTCKKYYDDFINILESKR